MNTYGTNSATSESGESDVILDAISEAKVTASSFVCGLSFQLPEMKGLRASSCVDDLDTNDFADGANALDDERLARRVIAERSFIFSLVYYRTRKIRRDVGVEMVSVLYEQVR